MVIESKEKTLAKLGMTKKSFKRKVRCSNELWAKMMLSHVFSDECDEYVFKRFVDSFLDKLDADEQQPKYILEIDGKTVCEMQGELEIVKREALIICYTIAGRRKFTTTFYPDKRVFKVAMESKSPMHKFLDGEPTTQEERKKIIEGADIVHKQVKRGTENTDLIITTFVFPHLDDYYAIDAIDNPNHSSKTTYSSPYKCKLVNKQITIDNIKIVRIK